MEDSSGGYNSRLQAAIGNKLIFINENVIGIIQDSLPVYRKTLETLINSLLKAELLERDLYESSSPVHTLKQPSEDPISADKKTAEISLRLFDYLKNFEYLENNCSYSPEELTIDRIIKIKRFFSFINWDRLSPSAPAPNERVMAEVEYSVRTGGDNLLKGIFRDSKRQLAESGSRILCGLEDIYVYLRESYKLDVRSRVLPALSLDGETASKKIEETVLQIKRTV